ncbi:hypothetical protein [Microcystis aeruginosa]|uniref:Peptidoglycan binding-like domain-containing protein n=1 Tax=Microcystis aeruginosa PCC 9808 TaxID=1160284 RepID=I4I035_MICAE|nr:hypothetical protein [Microcystis aeruginosa]MDB9430613.1 peptidoglycan-binding protein [Microcystis aeruginosa CS-555/01A07]CCI27659.1 hypothetical protein MICAG_360031 [Microcystis aeruginosa PCC 9808]
MKLQDIFNDSLVITLDQLKADSELVQQIEIRLKTLGLLDTAEVDGVWRNSTESALVEFCRLAFLNNMNTKVFGRTFAKKLIEMPVLIPNPLAGQAAVLNLTGSVGRSGNNNSADVQLVKNRLSDLGFSWIGRNGTVDNETIRTIELFQSIISGRTIVGGVDGRIDVNGRTHQFLQSGNAPQWQEMPSGSSTEGFINHDNQQGDTHDFGTNWMVETIQEAGKLYLTNFRNSHPNAALIATNNLSIARGGNTSIHQTHETGLSCDILLPRRDGTFGRITFRDGVYDRDAMEAMLRSIRNQGKYRIKQIFFNDFSLVVKGLCQNLNDGGVHDNHAHIDIETPQL